MQATELCSNSYNYELLTNLVAFLSKILAKYKLKPNYGQEIIVNENIIFACMYLKIVSITRPIIETYVWSIQKQNRARN